MAAHNDQPEHSWTLVQPADLHETASTLTGHVACHALLHMADHVACCEQHQLRHIRGDNSCLMPRTSPAGC